MKKRSLFLSMLLLFAFTGCTTDTVAPFGKKVKKEYFTGGKLRSVFIMDDATGRNGILKQYGYDGKLTSETTIRNGLKNGIETLYDKNGLVIRKTPYLNNQKEGLQQYFYSNGDVMAEVTYINNLKEGEAIKYNQDGSIYETVFFEHDKIMN